MWCHRNMNSLLVVFHLKTEKNMKIKASAKVEPCLFEVQNRWTTALNITREILNCWTRGEKVSHSSGGCHTVVRPTSPGKFPAWGGLARTLATLATYPFLTYVTTRSRRYLGYESFSYVRYDEVSHVPWLPFTIIRTFATLSYLSILSTVFHMTFSISSLYLSCTGSLKHIFAFLLICAFAI